MKWFVTAASFVAVTFALSVPLSFRFPILDVLSALSLLFLYAAIVIAVLRYRLYEIDVVIGKTVVFAVLAAFITVVYIALVVGVGTIVGNRRSPLLSAVAAAIVAVAFQPARQAARRVANRVVYGKRATPYEVLSGFTERAAEAYSSEDVLPRLVRVLAEGMGVDEARVWLSVGHELRPAAAWPVDGAIRAIPLASGGEMPAFPDSEHAFPVRHAGELLGAISVVPATNDPLGPERERLASDVAAQTALVLRNVRLIEELRELRRRIVAAQDARAKALERNLHDGAQQQLVALAVKQRLAESLVDRDPAKAKAMLADIQAETQDALDTLRDGARHLPAASGGPGTGGRAHEPSAKGGCAGRGLIRRRRSPHAGGRVGGLLLLPGGAAERREIRRRVAGVDPAHGGRGLAPVRGLRRRRGVRSERHVVRHGLAGDDRPPGCDRRRRPGRERAG